MDDDVFVVSAYPVEILSGCCARLGDPSARHSAMKSCRSGFMRCRTREGPIGSHQLLARAEKCESSSAETDDDDEEEWCRSRKFVPQRMVEELLWMKVWERRVRAAAAAGRAIVDDEIKSSVQLRCTLYFIAVSCEHGIGIAHVCVCVCVCAVEDIIINNQHQSTSTNLRI